MKKIRYEEYVKRVEKRLNKYSHDLYWYKYYFMKLNISHSHSYVLFRRYMNNDIKINWDIEYE